MVDKDLTSLLFNSDTVSEASQYDFNMEYLIVSPKYIKLHRNQYNCRVTVGLYTIANPFKVLNISKDTNTR